MTKTNQKKNNDKCKFCKTPLEEDVLKCKTCHELLYPLGKVLKYSPLFSVVLAILVLLISTGLWVKERADKQRETLRAEALEKTKMEILRKLSTANQANREISQKLPKETKDEIMNDIRKDFRLPAGSPNETFKQLEQIAGNAPEDSRIQTNLYLFRALKDSD